MSKTLPRERKSREKKEQNKIEVVTITARK
jgi:hypothetical protein